MQEEEIERKSRPTYVRNRHGEREYEILLEEIEPDRPTWLPNRTYPGDAGYDIAASELVVVDPGKFRDVPSNIRICLPAGIWGRITGRSSTLRRRSLLVNEGIIDNGYRGELRVGVFNLGRTTEIIKPGERIAQIIFADIIAARWRGVDELPVSERGERGFGSTGV